MSTGTFSEIPLSPQNHVGTQIFAEPLQEDGPSKIFGGHEIETTSQDEIFKNLKPQKKYEIETTSGMALKVVSASQKAQMKFKKIKEDFYAVRILVENNDKIGEQFVNLSTEIDRQLKTSNVTPVQEEQLERAITLCEKIVQLRSEVKQLLEKAGYTAFNGVFGCVGSIDKKMAAAHAEECCDDQVFFLKQIQNNIDGTFSEDQMELLAENIATWEKGIKIESKYFDIEKALQLSPAEKKQKQSTCSEIAFEYRKLAGVQRDKIKESLKEKPSEITTALLKKIIDLKKRCLASLENGSDQEEGLRKGFQKACSYYSSACPSRDLLQTEQEKEWASCGEKIESSINFLLKIQQEKQAGSQQLPLQAAWEKAAKAQQKVLELQVNKITDEAILNAKKYTSLLVNVANALKMGDEILAEELKGEAQKYLSFWESIFE